jgi:hypothetical protein
MNASLVNIHYRGQRRQLSVKLNNVPAEVCPHCELPVLAPDVKHQIDELGETMADTAGPLRWHVEKAA